MLFVMSFHNPQKMNVVPGVSQVAMLMPPVAKDN
jgi:hypothetical protein